MPLPLTTLMPTRLSPYLIGELEKAGPLVKLWEAADQSACLEEIGQEVRAVACGGHAVVDAALMRRLPKLEIVANFGVGYDGVDTTYAAARGVVVTHTPDVLNEEVADTALALILNTVRRFPSAERHVRDGAWRDGAFPLSDSLRGRSVGILGLGRIGKAIARRCEAFGLAVAYHGRRPQAGVPYLYFPTVIALAAATDILVVIAPGGEETRSLVDAAVLEAIGPQGYLINIARGSVVDEDALITALREGIIAGAGLDVFADEPRVPRALLDMEHVVLLPHVGSASRQTRRAMDQLVVDNLVSWAAGTGPLTPVPETPWPSGRDAA